MCQKMTLPKERPSKKELICLLLDQFLRPAYNFSSGSVRFVRNVLRTFNRLAGDVFTALPGLVSDILAAAISAIYSASHGAVSSTADDNLTRRLLAGLYEGRIKIGCGRICIENGRYDHQCCKKRNPKFFHVISPDVRIFVQLPVVLGNYQFSCR